MATTMPDAALPMIVVAQAEGGPAVVEPLPEAPAVVGELIEEPEAEVPFPPFDATYFPSQLLWLAITFIALYLIVARVALPRIGGILEDRRDRIASDLDQAERLKEQSDDALAGYERALAEARARAFAVGEEARATAKQQAAARQAEIEAELNKRLGRAEARIGEIKGKALADVDAVAADVAAALVERLVGEKPTQNEVQDAVAAAGGRETVGV